MTRRILSALRLWGTLLLLASTAGAQPSPGQHDQSGERAAPANSSHSEQKAIMHRGEKGMGFSQTATTHHFLLKPEGGLIAVSGNNPKDIARRDEIRMHLSHIAHAFSEGDFDIPMFVHDEVPPGLPVMKMRSRDIDYRFKETAAGGEVSISSRSPEVVQAIHDFLIYQIREHKTGDPIPRSRP